MQNRKINTNNKSGIKGVSWNKVAKSWNVQIRTKNRKNFGYYEDLELAELVAEMIDSAKSQPEPNPEDEPERLPEVGEPSPEREEEQP